MMTTETVSRQLRARRQVLGLSLSDVARRAGTSAATLSRYESGWTRFETYTLRKLAAALGCDLKIQLLPNPVPAQGVSLAAAVIRLRRLFWDHALAESDFSSHAVWVTERILEFGNLDDIHVLRETLGRKRFVESVSVAERVSPRTRRFWAQILELEGKPCTRKYSRPTVWSF